MRLSSRVPRSGQRREVTLRMKPFSAHLGFLLKELTLPKLRAPSSISCCVALESNAPSSAFSLVFGWI